MSYLANLSSLSIETQRKVAAFVGAIVGDAACLHLDWIYDQKKVSQIVGPDGKDPAFWNESHCPFFTLPNGKVSCYADEAIQVLSCMADNAGIFDDAKVIDKFLCHFGEPSSPYQIALAKRKDKKYPIEGKCFALKKLNMHAICMQIVDHPHIISWIADILLMGFLTARILITS